MAIHKAIAAGRVTKQPDGVFDLDKAVEEFNDNTHHEFGHVNVGPGRKGIKAAPKKEMQGTGYAKARAETQTYEGLLKRLRYEERAGNLVPAAAVEQARFTEFRSLREACFNIPNRIAALLAGETDVARCQVLLEGELVKVFEAFSEGKLAA